MSKFNRNPSLLRGKRARLEQMEDLTLLLVKHIFLILSSHPSLPGILLTIFTIATRLPSFQTLPNSLLALTYKLSHISISEMLDSIKFQFICFRNCCCAALFECHANNPKAIRQRCIFLKGEDPERTSKMSKNEEQFYVKVKFIPRT